MRLIGNLSFEMMACGGTYVQLNIADVTVTNLFFDNGGRAHIHVSWLHPFKEQRLVVVGLQRVEYGSSEPLRLECQAFLGAMATRQPPLTERAERTVRAAGGAALADDQRPAGASVDRIVLIA